MRYVDPSTGEEVTDRVPACDVSDPRQAGGRWVEFHEGARLHLRRELEQGGAAGSDAYPRQDARRTFTEEGPQVSPKRTQNVHSNENEAPSRSPLRLVSQRIGRDSNSRYAFTYTHFPDFIGKREIRVSRAENAVKLGNPARPCARIYESGARQNVHSAYTTGTVWAHWSVSV